MTSTAPILHTRFLYNSRIDSSFPKSSAPVIMINNGTLDLHNTDPVKENHQVRGLSVLL